MGDTLESSAVKLAGLVAFQVLPCLARVNESLSWVTATSVSSSLLRLHMVLSRKSMGRLFRRSMLKLTIWLADTVNWNMSVSVGAVIESYTE